MTFLTRRQERSIVVTCATIKGSPAPTKPELRTMDASAITHPMAQIKHPTQTQHTSRVARRAGHVALAMVLAGSVLSHAPALAQTQAQAQAQASSATLTTLSLEQLLEVSIVGASKYEQKQSEVAAAVSVITRQEIKSYAGPPWVRRWPACPVSTPLMTGSTRTWAREASACRATTTRGCW